MWDQSLSDLMIRGGPVMWPLLACSILGVALILDRYFIVFLRSSSLHWRWEQIETLARAGNVAKAVEQLERCDAPAGRVGVQYLEHLDDAEKHRDEIVSREATLEVLRLERRMGTLAMVFQVAPLLGLLGTVTGLVDAFHQIEIKAGQVQPGNLAAGIWEALLTTVFGLVIAVPCQMAYHWIDARIGRLVVEMELTPTYLGEWLPDRVGS